MAGTGRSSTQQDGSCGVNAALSGDSGRRWGVLLGASGPVSIWASIPRQHIAQLSSLPL